MRNYLLFLFLLLSVNIYAQNVEFIFGGQVSNYETGKKEGSVTVKLVAGGRVVSTAQTATNGKYNLSATMPAKSNFEVIFTKSGFVSKRVAFNFSTMNTERMKEGEKLTPVQDLSLDLFMVKPNIDFSFLEREPVATFNLNTDNLVPKIDAESMQRVKQKIEALLSTPAVEEPKNSDASYNAAIKLGDQLFTQKKYEEALKQYETAAGIKPKEMYPQKRIAELDALIKAKNSENAAVSEKDEQYNNYIKAADNFRDKKQYTDAIAKYNTALRVKYEQYPKDEIKKIEVILAEISKEQQADTRFQDAVAEGDAAAKAKDFKLAETLFREAIELKKDEQYPKNQLNFVLGEIKKQEAAEAKKKTYDEAIKTADDLFNQQKYTEAKAKYAAASLLIPEEVYPKDRIKESDAMIAKMALEKKNAEAIAKIMTDGQKLMDEKSFDAAKQKFGEAIKIDATNPAPQAKINEIDGLIKAAEASKKQNYDLAIKEGDNLFSSAKYDEAKAKYNEALKISPTEVYPKDKIKESDAAIAKLAADKKNADTIAQLFADAQKLLTEKSYPSAKVKYTEVLKLDVQNSEAKAKIEEIEGLIKAAENSANLKKEYDAALKAADALFTAAKFEEAKAKYEEASKVLPEEVYPKEKIKEANEKIAQNADARKKQENITALLSEGQGLLDGKAFSDAREKYDEVLKIETDQKVAKSKIAEIEALIKANEAEATKKKSYDDAIKSADALFAAEKFEDAKKQFQAASLILSSETYPKDKIKEIDEALAKINAKKKNDEVIAKLLLDGQKLLDDKTYPQAKTKYDEILKIDPTNTEATAKLSEINKLMQSSAEAEAKQKQYDAALKSADEFLSKSKLEEAKSKYMEALSIKADENYPKEKLKEIETTIAKNAEEVIKQANLAKLFSEGQSFIDTKSYADAKNKYAEILSLDATQTKAQTKLDEVNKLMQAGADAAAKQKMYDDAVASANQLFSDSKLDEAKSKYKEATGLLPNENYPKEKLKVIDDLLAKKAADEQKASALTKLYEEGQSAIDKKAYTDAKKKFTEILKLDPSQGKAQTKLDEINALMQAGADAEAKQKMYDSAVAAADQLFTASKYEEAKSKYLEAIGVRPDENYPKEKLITIDDLLAKKAAIGQTEQRISKLFEEGQQLIDAKSYTAAQDKYNEILALDAKKNLATVKLDEIQRLIKADDEAKNANKIFAGLVSEGDKAVKESDFDLARQKYGAALDINEDGATREKYKAVQAKMAETKAKVLVNEKFEESIKLAKALLDEGKLTEARKQYQAAGHLDESRPEPKLRIAEIDARLNKESEADKTYRAFIDKGDALVKEEKYLPALDEFNKAITMRPTEKEPKEKADEALRLEKAKGDVADQQFEKLLEAARKKVTERDFEKATDILNRAINFRSAARASDKRPENLLAEIERLRATDKNYSEKIGAGEMEASAKNYTAAIARFEEASKLKPNESLPNERIVALKKELAEFTGSSEKERLFNESFNKGQTELMEKSYKNALSSFKKAKEYKPSDQASSDKIAEIEQILDDLKNQELNEKVSREKMAGMLKEADRLFKLGDWSQAKIAYQGIVAIDKDQPYAKNQIRECDVKLKGEQDKMANEAYKGIIASANNNFEKKDFNRSKELFTKATKLRPSDPYPIQRLADLQRLMNPNVLESGELEDLGDIYTGEDGAVDLAKSARAQNFDQNSDVLGIQKSASQKITENTNLAIDRNRNTKTEISNVQTRALNTAISANEKRDESNEQLRIIQQKASAGLEQDALFERADNLKSKEKIEYSDKTKSEIDVAQQLAYKVNTEKVKDNTSRIASENGKRGMDYSAAQFEAGTEITRLSIQAQESMNDDDSRRATQILIEKGINETSQTTLDLVNDRSKVGETNQQILTDQKKSIVRRTNEANNATKDNNTSLKGIKKREESVNLKRLTDNAQATKLTSKELDITVSKSEVANYEKTQRQLENVVEIENKSKVVQGQSTDLGNQSSNARLTTAAELNNLAQQIEAESSETIDRQLKNTQTVNEMQAVSSSKLTSLQEKTIENQQSLTEAINAVDTKPSTVTSKNTLGEKYPEGVTEEKFSRNGNDGRINTIITRRVVVIDGHGDVYVRTQTNGVSTYKKNNVSITEYAWQRETQNSTLQRH